MSADQRFRAAARRLIVGGGAPALYRPVTGEPVQTYVALVRSVTAIGEYGTTSAGRPAADLLSEDVPNPRSGDRIEFADSAWTVDNRDSDDGYVIRVWVSEP